MLTFFAQDGVTHTLVYANADLTKATQASEVLAFCDHWRSVSGRDPQLLVFDSRLTTQQTLGALDARGVRFLTLRMRTAALATRIAALPASAWRTVALDRDGAYRKRQVAEEPHARFFAYLGTVRQLVVRGLGREAPTVLITNDRSATAKALIERYARRMTIEQRLAESIRSFHVDALGSAVPLNVDLDVVLSVLAGAVCLAPAPALRLRDSHSRHPAAPLPLHRWNQPQPRRRDRRPARPPHLFTRAARRRPSAGRCPLVAGPTPPLRVRLNLWSISLRENPR